MPIIDDNGNLFGRINIIDAIVVFLLLVTVAAGANFVLNDGDSSDTFDSHDATIVFRVTDLQPYEATAIPDGRIKSSRKINAITAKNITPSTVVVINATSQTAYEHPVHKTATLELNITVRETSGDPFFLGKPLEVGRTLTLDLGPITVNGTITDTNASN